MDGTHAVEYALPYSAKRKSDVEIFSGRYEGGGHIISDRCYPTFLWRFPATPLLFPRRSRTSSRCGLNRWQLATSPIRVARSVRDNEVATALEDQGMAWRLGNGVLMETHVVMSAILTQEIVLSSSCIIHVLCIYERFLQSSD